MPVRIRIPRNFLTGRFGRSLLAAAAVLLLAGTVTAAYIWHSFAVFIDHRLSGEIFELASHVYAAPELIVVGESRRRDDVVAQLRRFGYSDSPRDPTPYGVVRVAGEVVEVRPGPASLVGAGEAARLQFAGDKLARIQSLRDGRPRDAAWLDPQLITNLFDRRRTKRRLVQYDELPPQLIQALLAAEDRRFFSHPGISFWDALRALRHDLGIWLGFRPGARPHGASTLTMQLSRNFFLNRDLSLKRKASEAVIALQLERRFPKEKILELYANEVYLGHRGSFSIHGFGEGAQAYFEKDISQLTLAESAFLAGIIRGPNRYNPYRSPERALERRNYILDSMVETGALTVEQAEAAKRAPLGIAPANIEASEAPYFVDLVNDRMLENYSEEELITSSYRVYTTIDLNLQHAASEALQESLPELDAKVAQRFRRRKGPSPQVQVALVALDPRTGAVKALIGGRDYNQSQLNRVVAHRQPGSSFKPFVYAAAFAASLEDPEHAITPITTVVDEPTIFEFEGQEYEPSNYGEKFFGITTVRDALIHSMNVATVKVAEMTGYQRVAELAVSAGLNPRLRPTPAISLGAYDSMPLEVVGAYTVFANEGKHLQPYLIARVHDREGRLLRRQEINARPVLDPRVAYMVVDLLQDAINRGTGAGARARGFVAPAAGKTGTSRDAWFIGFTSNLLCAVWVGFDDNTDLGLPGSSAALPIWTAFMKRAVAMPAYRNTEEFIPPEGIVSVPLDPDTLFVATPDCPSVRTERFIAGTEPTELCPRHRPSRLRQVTRKLLRAVGIGGGGDKRDPEKDEEPADAQPKTDSEPPPRSPPPMLNRAASALRHPKPRTAPPPSPANKTKPPPPPSEE